MANMTHSRHENTFRDLADAWDKWEDFEPGRSEYEDRARVRIVELVREMHNQFVDDGTYDEVG